MIFTLDKVILSGVFVNNRSNQKFELFKVRGSVILNNLYSLLYLVFVCTVLQVRVDSYLFRGFEFVAKFQVSKFNPYLASVTFIQPLIFENQGLYKYKIGNIWVNVS